MKGMDISRWTGKAKGRNAAVRHSDLVYTVATASDAGPSVREQTAAALALIDNNLRDAGSDRTRLLSVQIFLADIGDKEEMNEVWCDWIGSDWQNWPQRACVQAGLSRGTRVEVVVVAAVGH